MKTYTETRGMFLFAGVPAERLPETRPDVIDLSGANLSGADLRGADLRWADLSWASLSGAAHDRWTTWPTGFTPTEQAP